MCCRYTLVDLKALAALVEALGAGVDLDDLPKRYNAALTDKLPAIVRTKARNQVVPLSFGLRQPPRPPARSGSLLANARAETLLERPTFREAAQARRCLIPADGFYEWERRGAARLPHYFRLRDSPAFFFAGLWQPATTDAPESFAVVTTAANAVLAPIHDRMPVILGPNSGPAWLGDEPLPPARLAQLCRPLRDDLLTRHRVTTKVNRVGYEAPDCLVPVGADEGLGADDAQAELGF